MTLEVLQPTPFLLISIYKQNQFLAKPILLGFKLVFRVFHNMVVKKVYMTRFSNIRRCFNPLHRKSTMKPLFVLKNFTMWSQNALGSVWMLTLRSRIRHWHQMGSNSAVWMVSISALGIGQQCHETFGHPCGSPPTIPSLPAPNLAGIESFPLPPLVPLRSRS